MKKFTLIAAFVVMASFTFAQVVGVHAPTKNKAQKTEQISIKGEPEAAWEVTFEEDPVVWTIAHDEGEADWAVTDSITTGVILENGPDFTDETLPEGALASAMWVYCGRQSVGDYSESGNNFAYIDGISDLLSGTEEIKNAWIQFDSIDLSTVDNPKLTFYQNYKALNSAFSYLDISLDGGATWTESIELNEGVEGNTFGDDYYQIILTNYISNEANVSLRFRWQTTEAAIGGYGYGWEIDDLKIVDNPDVDMKLVDARMNFFEYVDYTDPANSSYYHISSHYGSIPAAQFANDMAAMLWNAEVENNGNLDNAPEFNVQVFDPSGAEIYNETATGNTLSVTQKDTIDLLTPEFSMTDPALGEYTVVYNIDIADDANPENNIDTTYFNVTDTTFARDLGNPVSSTGPSRWIDGGVDTDMIGTDYLYLHEAEIHSMTVFIGADTDPGTGFVAHLMEFDEDTEEWVDIVTSPLVTLEEGDIGDWMEFEFPVSVPIIPDPETGYNVKAALEFYYNDTDNELTVGYDPSVPVSPWGTTWYMNEGSNAGEWYTITNWSRGGLAIRLNYDLDSDAVNELNTDNLSIYPNPSNGIVRIDNVEGNDVEVFNLVGQRIYSVENAEQNVSLNLSNQPEGTYLVRISGTNGTKTQKISLIK